MLCLLSYHRFWNDHYALKLFFFQGRVFFTIGCVLTAVALCYSTTLSLGHPTGTCTWLVFLCLGKACTCFWLKKVSDEERLSCKEEELCSRPATYSSRSETGSIFNIRLNDATLSLTFLLTSFEFTLFFTCGLPSNCIWMCINVMFSCNVYSRVVHQFCLISSWRGQTLSLWVTSLLAKV